MPIGRILLVDDHGDTLRLLSKLLRMNGYDVLTASSAEEALATATSEHCDLLVSDIGLPDRTGIELMQDIRALRQIPGIALTGYGEDHFVQSSKDAGFTRHIVKPVVLQDLLVAIEQVIKPAP